MKCQLIRAETIEQQKELWPHVEHLIKSAMKKGRISDFDIVRKSVQDGNGLLWIAWDGEKIKAAAVTEVHEANGEKFCTVVGCGGSNRSEWLHLMAGLEDHGRKMGCNTMRIYGRRGWQRLLPDYRVSRVLLERAL